jgi:hypothetical protein
LSTLLFLPSIYFFSSTLSINIMGMFSYTCSKCGPKEQFDWMSLCVVQMIPSRKTNQTVYLVRGTYDGYGSIKVAVQGQDEPVTVHPHQFLADHVDVKEGDLYGTKMYCRGKDNEDMIKMMLNQQGKMMDMLIGKDSTTDYEEDCCCVPENVEVLEELTAEMLTELPKAKAVLKARNKRKAASKRKAEAEAGQEKPATSANKKVQEDDS